MMIPELAAVVDSLKAGRSVAPVSVRTFLSWFGAQRRGFLVVSSIRKQLEGAGLVTVPDFESSWLDAPIEFQLWTGAEHEEAPGVEEAQVVDDSIVPDSAAAVAEPVANWVSKDHTYRIGKLEAANNGVTAINRNASLSEASTLMMARDFSQLPVMTGERDVQGIISWKSIGSRLALG